MWYLCTYTTITLTLVKEALLGMVALNGTPNICWGLLFLHMNMGTPTRFQMFTCLAHVGGLKLNGGLQSLGLEKRSNKMN